MKNIKSITKEIIKFRDARDWKQFHNPKDVSISLVLEAAELLEHFQWKSPAEIKRKKRGHNFQDFPIIEIGIASQPAAGRQ